VDLTYAQATGFDQAYFRDPLKLLGGIVEAPRFNLRNELMIRKHVHATVLTSLYRVASKGSDEDRRAVNEVIRRCFPPTLRNYLFTPGGDVRTHVLDVSDLGVTIRMHRKAIVDDVVSTFTTAWPVEDMDAVEPAVLEQMVDGMSEELQLVLRRFKHRLDWARAELLKLQEIEFKKGALDPEDRAHRRRCQRMVLRFKGALKRGKGSAEGGYSDSATMGALAREGFLPGYGLESGSIVGTAEPPRLTEGLTDFSLPRYPSIALREYVPGNAIYANGLRFVPRVYQLSADDTLRFNVLPEQKAIQEVGVDDGTAALGQQEVRAVPVCDVVMPAQSHISDEEEFRFQMPVEVYGFDRGFHRGGVAYACGDLQIQFRRGVRLRLVNAGPRSMVAQQKLGYPICLACGRSNSPYASTESHKKFLETHQERCDHEVQPTGFYADVEVDVLGFHELVDREQAYSLVEALRMGASRTLDMELEDLQILGIGRPDEDLVDVYLYDPMPGGSGLLEQLCDQWAEVVEAALVIVQDCAGACERSCIDCLQTYRNRFYHEHLNRHVALEVLSAAGGALVEQYPIKEKLPTTLSTTGQPQTYIEQRFKDLLVAANFPDPVCQHHMDLGGAWGQTIPDFFYEGDDEDDPGICIYLDGMAGHIHGNPEQKEKDDLIRARLREENYRVAAIPSIHIDDKDAMVGHISKIAHWLVGKAKKKELKADTGWWVEPDTAAVAVKPTTQEILESDLPADSQGLSEVISLPWVDEETAEPDTTVPVYDLDVAAGAFSDEQIPEAIGYVLLPTNQVRPGRFVARVVGDSMDKVASKGSWCLWEHLGAEGVAAPAPGEDLLVRRPDENDPELGAYTFKRLLQADTGLSLIPVSNNPDHARIDLNETDDLGAVARFVCVVVNGMEGGP